MSGLIDRLNQPTPPALERKERRQRRITPRSTPRRPHVSPRNQPPVLVRGDLSGLPLQVRRPKKSRARRRYDLTLNVPGAEMRLPALPQIEVGMRLVSAVMVIGLAIMLYFLWTSSTFKVEAADVQGLQRLSSVDVNTVLDVAGKPVFAVDARALEKRLKEAFPEFSSVSVWVGFPKDVRVVVEERTPILTWKQDGRTVLVDANGVAFPPRALGQPGPALIVEASSSPPASPPADPNFGAALESNEQASFMPVEMVSAILSMSAIAPQKSTLIYSTEHGLGWKDAQGWQVFFGDVRGIDMKLKVYQGLVKYLNREKVKPVLISVEHVHAPYYRLER